jgi:hypothetical protein
MEYLKKDLTIYLFRDYVLCNLLAISFLFSFLFISRKKYVKISRASFLYPKPLLHRRKKMKSKMDVKEIMQWRKAIEHLRLLTEGKGEFPSVNIEIEQCILSAIERSDPPLNFSLSSLSCILCEVSEQSGWLHELAGNLLNDEDITSSISLADMLSAIEIGIGGPIPIADFASWGEVFDFVVAHCPPLGGCDDFSAFRAEITSKSPPLTRGEMHRIMTNWRQLLIPCSSLSWFCDDYIWRIFSSKMLEKMRPLTQNCVLRMLGKKE